MNIFDYFQISSLAIFLAVFWGRTFRLRQKGTEVIRLGSGKKGAAAFLEKSFLIFFPLWLFEILATSLHLNIQILPDVLIKPFFSGVPVQTAGLFTICFGILLFIGALISFKASWRIGIDPVNPGRLITTGIFSLSRNPVFLSMDLYFLGTFFITGNLFFLLSFVGMALGFHFQIRQEEVFLSEKFGKPYLSYMSHVRRYV